MLKVRLNSHMRLLGATGNGEEYELYSEEEYELYSGEDSELYSGEEYELDSGEEIRSSSLVWHCTTHISVSYFV